MSNRSEFLFIYGTLLATAQHPLGRLLQENAKFVGKGTVQARLYEITEIDAQGTNIYPGAIPSPQKEDRVFGEVWHILNQEELFPVFDTYEACSDEWEEPHEFLYRRIPVLMEDGSHITAGSYLYAWDLSKAKPIASGRYDKVSPDVR